MAAETSGRTSLYRPFDSDSDLLYVGISSRPLGRLRHTLQRLASLLKAAEGRRLTYAELTA